MIRPILQVPDPMLRRKSEELAPGTDFSAICSDLMDTRRHHKALGLAAPQIGVMLRVVSVRPGDFFGYGCLINPRIVRHGQARAFDFEGCLSISNGRKRYRVERWEVVTVNFIDMMAVERTVVAKRAAARLIQHEIDHLDGKLIA